MRSSTWNGLPQNLHLRVFFMVLETAGSPQEEQGQEEVKKEEEFCGKFWKKTEPEEDGISNRQEYPSFVSPLTLAKVARHHHRSWWDSVIIRHRECRDFDLASNRIGIEKTSENRRNRRNLKPDLPHNRLSRQHILGQTFVPCLTA